MAQKQGNFVVYPLPGDTFVMDKLRGSVLVADPNYFGSLGFNSRDGFSERAREENPEIWGFYHTPQTVEENNAIIRSFERDKQRTRPTTFFIAETISCPLSCTYCFEKDARDAGDKKRLVEEDISKIDGAIKAYRDLRGLPPEKVCINLFGGEPLQRAFFGLNQGLLELAKQSGYWVDVVTSGATLSSDYLDLLSQYRGSIREVDITLDGSREIQDSQRPIGRGRSQRGSFDLVARSIDQLLERKVRVLAKQNLGVRGIANLEQHVEGMLSRGWYDSSNFVHGINLIQDYGGIATNGQKIDDEGAYILAVMDLFSRGDMKELLERTRFEGIKFTENLVQASGALRRKDGSSPFDSYPRYAHCHPTDGTTVTIAPNGDLYGCNWSIGKTKPFGNVFGNPGFESMRSTFVRNVVDNPLCQECDVSTSCGGGCRHSQMVSGEEAYHLFCQDTVYKSHLSFLRGARERGLFDRKGERLVQVGKGFNFGYKYENRTESSQQV